MLTVLAPCVLPLLPVIIGGSISGNAANKKRPYIIAISLALSLIIFTLLLKATTLLINLPPQAITYFSGTLIIIIGLLSLFPTLYEKIIIGLGIQSRSQRLLGEGTKQKNQYLGPIIIGAALGPVFSSCSPVYAYILATILPVDFGQAFAYIISYVLGLSLILLLIGILGQKFVARLKWASNPKGLFQRIVATLFIVVGLLVLSGYDKKFQTFVSEHTFLNFDALTSKLLPASQVQTKEGGEVLNVKPYPAPEFEGLSNWINSSPLKKSDLKSKVVLVDFWTYSCINCIRTQSYLKGWYSTYKSSGLEIIGVHAPEFAFEKVPSNVEKAVKEAGLKYPIALDNDFATWNAFDNQYWPAAYLIDKEGSVRRVHFGEGGYKETEAAMRELLQENGGSVPDKPFIKGDSAVPASSKETPETYLGSRRATNYAGKPALLLGKTQEFAPPAGLQINQWALSGEWSVEAETVTAVSQNSRLQFKVAAKDVYLVAGSSLPQAIGVKLNGTPISQTKAAGSDIENSQVAIQEAKLYRLIHYNTFTKGGVLELSIPPGVSLNVFTFGS